MSNPHIPHLRRSIELAKNAVKNGNHPFGALLVLDGKIILEAENSVVTDQDVTQHAELSLISQASKRFSSADLKRAVLYTSTEPCAMCAGAIFWSGIRSVIYGCPAPALEEIAHGKFMIPCREVFARAEEPVLVEGPLLESEAVSVHVGFW